MALKDTTSYVFQKLFKRCLGKGLIHFFTDKSLCRSSEKVIKMYILVRRLRKFPAIRDKISTNILYGELGT